MADKKAVAQTENSTTSGNHTKGVGVRHNRISVFGQLEISNHSYN